MAAVSDTPEPVVPAEVPEERIARVSQEIETLADELDLERPLSTRAVVEALSATDRASERRVEYERLAAELRELDAAVRRTADATAFANEAITAAAEARDADVTRWNKTLADLSLHANLDMPRSLTAVGDISTQQAELRLLDETRRRIVGMKQRNGETDRVLTTILEAADLPRFEPGDGLAALRDLEGRWNEHRDALTRRRTVEHASQEWLANRNSLNERIRAVQTALDELVSAGGCRGMEEFRSAAAALAERARVDVELRQLYNAQPELVGPDSAELAEELYKMSPDDLAAQAAELEDRLVRFIAERDNAIQQSGELRLRLRQLETEDSISQLHTTIDRLTEEMRVAGRHWGVLTIARTLLDRTRAEFQESRQPALLGAASEYFRRMTLDRYTTVRAVLGENRFEVVTDGSLARRPEQLSRGTVEQLFLALRFALIEEYCRNTEPMPVLLDDVLVNFDPERALAAASAIIKLSQRHQVIALTCHPETVTMFQEAAIAAGVEPPNIVSLKPGTSAEAANPDPAISEPSAGPVPGSAPSGSIDAAEPGRPRMHPLL
ncbi:MAG: hypothetical protein IIB26_09815 [Chloroflexi bacterium]|nr:hypothetical protein [Chloroflexota bacterium]